MAVANVEHRACAKQTKIKFWEDGPATPRGYRMPEVTARGLPPCGAGDGNDIFHLPPPSCPKPVGEVAEAERDLLFLCLAERVAVWDAVADYVQEQLLLRKGVRIPTFGSFSLASERIEAKDGTMVIQWPAFHLARNLAGIRNFTDNKDYLPGHKELEALRFSEMATAASVSRQTGKACIFGTTSLISHCLRKGENVAFVLKDIGVLLIEGTGVHMKFYYDFLERISGKENLEKVVFKVPWLLDMLVPRVAAVASLTSSGQVIVFPRFKREFAPKPPPGKPCRASKRLLLRLGRGKKEEFPALPPLTSWIHLTIPVDTTQSEGGTSEDKRKASQLPAIPGAFSAKKEPQEEKRKCSIKSKASEVDPAERA
ncbi:coiled-coil domain-containing protein 81-like [Lagopus muta]|uniref:coiled-coil domain-containing protein 81-like n=1 Tax=Lagopus muta TaxID=64668 RepID=UPI0020A03712|nr:coiled-coil domain-containing protein 81-like [Lagopus muta]